MKDEDAAWVNSVHVVPLQAGQQLVVLEIESSEQCDSGLAAEAELHWKGEQRMALSRCANLKHVFQRTARDCPDVTFLTLEVGLMEAPSLLQPHMNLQHQPGDDQSWLWVSQLRPYTSDPVPCRSAVGGR